MRYVFGVVVVVSTIAGRVHAQSSSIAEQLFNEARDLVKANRWTEACPKFEASLRYDPLLGTRLNLATCYEHIGRLASAWGLYRDSIELARKAGDVKRINYAQQQAAALEPRLPKLVISASANPPAGFIVRRDGTPIEFAELGVALYVDPGPHVVSASAPGFEAFTQTVTLVEGKTEALVVPDLVPKLIADASKPIADSPKPVSKLPMPLVEHRGDVPNPVVSSSKTRKYVAIGAGAVGVTAVGVGLLFGAKANSTYQDAKELCGASLVCSPDNFGEGKQLVQDAHTSATISTVCVIAGGAAIAAGALVFLTTPRAKERATARMVPVVRDHSAGLGIMGRF